MSDIQSMIGKLIPQDAEVERDAIHVAVIPLVAGESHLFRGDAVRLGPDNTAYKGGYRKEGYSPDIGIVDPFLDWTIKKGQRFWCFLFPGSIVGMRHHWRHPILDGESRKNMDSSERWLRDVFNTYNADFDQFMKDAIKGEPEFCAMGKSLHCWANLPGDIRERFWKEVKTYLGEESVSEELIQRTLWTCSC